MAQDGSAGIVPKGIKQWEDVCDELGHPPGGVALAWLLHQPAVTAPIIGPRTIEQLEASLRTLEVSLDDAALARLDEILMRPGAGPGVLRLVKAQAL